VRTVSRAVEQRGGGQRHGAWLAQPGANEQGEWGEFSSCSRPALPPGSYSLAQKDTHLGVSTQKPALKYSGVASGVKWQHELPSSSVQADRGRGATRASRACRQHNEKLLSQACRPADRVGDQHASRAARAGSRTKFAPAIAVAHSIEAGGELKQVVNVAQYRHVSIQVHQPAGQAAEQGVAHSGALRRQKGVRGGWQRQAKAAPSPCSILPNGLVTKQWC
jgi:hypothetical protein